MSAHVLLFLLFVCTEASRGTPGRTALDNYPLIDGHNDLAYNLYLKLHNQIDNFSLDKDLSHDPLFGLPVCNSCNTDLARINKGKLGAQFWAAYVDCNVESDIVGRSLEQVDVIKRFVNKYPHDLELVTTADGIVDAFERKRLASLIGLEGGHSIDNKMALLRQFYELGVRYMTLTHSCDLPWADSSLADETSSSRGLTEFGEKIILEMNRLGMMVDLSHVSHRVMRRAIDVSRAPVIFSHSSAFAVFPHHRNVRDDILRSVQANGGIVMVNFYSKFLGEGHVTISDVARHINHIVDVAGIDHVGIGADFDGVDSFPEGLEDVSKYPDLFDFLKVSNEQKWTIPNLEKLAGRNFYRVFKRVEEVRDKLAAELPDESLIPPEDLPGGATCTSTRTVFSFVTLVLLFVLQ